MTYRDQEECQRVKLVLQCVKENLGQVWQLTSGNSGGQHTEHRRPQVEIPFHQTLSSFLQVLKISLLGHKKRIIASLAERPYEEPPVKPPRLSQIRVRTSLHSSQCSFRVWSEGLKASFLSAGQLTVSHSCRSSAKTFLDPSPHPPSVRWSPTQGAQWTLCCQ